jgi:hypothetical protein
MISPDFQLAFADLIASPELCENALQNEAAFFSSYQLSEKEKLRLHSVLRQKGMNTCCSLYRMNRITPLYMQLTNTALILGDLFVKIVKDFWKYYTKSSLQFKEEVLAFGYYLLEQIETGKIKIPYLKEVLHLEIAINELNYMPEGNSKQLDFEYDILEILYYLDKKTLAQQKFKPQKTSYTVYLKENKLAMELI